MDNDFSKKLITSVGDFTKKMIDEHINSMSEEEKNKELERLYLEVVGGKGILSALASSPAFDKDVKQEEYGSPVVFPNMDSIPGYDKIKEQIEEDKKEPTAEPEKPKEEVHTDLKQVAQEQDNDPNTASIYRSDALSAVKDDMKNFKDIKIPSEDERKTEIIEELPQGGSNVKTKVLSSPDIPFTSKTNDMWSSAGSPISPGTLNLKD